MCILSIKRLAFVTILLTYGLIVFGGYVASSESGMGCGPEWPLCNGEVIPTLKGDTLIEFAHRVIGAILAISCVILFLKILRAKIDPAIRNIGYWMIGLLVIQVLLGAVVVILDLPSIIVSSHLMIAMVFLASLIWIWRKADDKKPLGNSSTGDISDHKSIILHLNIILVLLLLTLAFGAYTKHEWYGLGCGWFDCGSTLLPTIDNPAGIIQTIHRLFAVLSAIYILALTCWAFLKKWSSPLRWRLILASITVIIQLVIGVLTITSFIDLTMAVLHLAVGTFLFSVLAESRAVMGKDRAQSRKGQLFTGEMSSKVRTRV
ncbi:cytochrome c oxidase assembly protein subunit 15 [Mesobacillus persicus]|uniref:Cytochrome c oxidase assembly protein subunit 15 n=1 Tax=Mesobacillus persicus TaxID=930146 RepID=A0A1H8KIZ3_9BACI|nr:COX15/CtaA family protein [Mesobacillus persicus]SEN92933.1 cytochrome c oxidase assembly protein subunit 15 [Mesobacillus persicus]